MANPAERAIRHGQTVVHDEPGFRIDFDPADGIIRVGRLLLRTEAEVDRYIATLLRLFPEVRRRGPVRLMVDLRESALRPQATADRLRRHNLELYRAGERVALVVESALFKLQLRRTQVPEFQQLFTSPADAEAWLRS